MNHPSAQPREAMSLVRENLLWPRRQEPAVRTELAHRYLAYAKSIGIRYRGQAESIDDLIQVASVGLMNAIERYDPARGIPFVAFASPTIHGELKRHFRDRVSTLKVPRGIYDRIGVMERVLADLRTSLAHEPSITEIAEAMECSEDDVLEARQATLARNPDGFTDSPDDESGSKAQEDHLGKDDEGYRLAEDRIITGQALGLLNKDDRSMVLLRFRDELTQSQIADRIGCSQMQVSRRLRSILDSMNRQVAGTPAK